MNAPKA